MVFFDTPNEKESTFELLPDGSYRVMVAGSEMKQTKAGTGTYLAVRFQVIGDADKRTLTHRFNYANQNPTAQRIGRAELKKLLSAIGVTQAITYENEFHRLIADKVLVVDVTSEEGGNGQPQNKVKAFKPDGAPVAASVLDIPF